MDFHGFMEDEFSAPGGLVDPMGTLLDECGRQVEEVLRKLPADTKIVIVGAGGIGHWVGALLAQSTIIQEVERPKSSYGLGEPVTIKGHITVEERHRAWLSDQVAMLREMTKIDLSELVRQVEPPLSPKQKGKAKRPERQTYRGYSNHRRKW